MRKFLVVGCGGSGGATLRFLMDELKAGLAEQGIQALPKAWQFVHVDVPTAPDSGPGLLRSVQGQGGRYLSLSYPGAKYADIASGLYSKLREGEALPAVASWWPDPARVNFPVVDGAGQYRTVGRALTLAMLGQAIRPALQAAWTDLNSADTLEGLKAVARRMPGAGAVEQGHTPLVFVVSSMAGGSGASMVLDVCDVLGSALTGIQPDNIGLFLYTPDVFASLGQAATTGVEANAAAALAELISAQTRACRVDQGADATDPEAAILSALGFPDRLPEQPFGRVFPVGASIGDIGAKLGDGEPNTIYRALGRGLSSLMLSGGATESFAQYDLVNKGMTGYREDFGWGEEPTKVAWGCFGFASLSLGRDRYSEYAAQRLARSAIDRLATGHQQPGDPTPGVEQVRRLVDARWGSFCDSVGLPKPGETAKQWFVRQPLPQQARTNAAASIRSELIDGALSTYGQVDDIGMWARQVENQVMQRNAKLQTRIDRAAQLWALQWQRDLVVALERELAVSIGLLGLRYAVGLLEHTQGFLLRWSEELRAAGRPVDPGRLPAKAAANVQQFAQARGKVKNTQAIHDDVRGGYQRQLETAILARCGTLAGEMLTSMTTDLLGSLEAACREGLKTIEHARSAHPADTGLAQLRTNDYASWPSDDDQVVPERFEHAENEVLLTIAEEFPLLYGAHLSAAAQDAAGSPARDVTARQVITGIWPTVGGQRAPGGLVQMESPWRSGAVPVHPETGEPIVPRKAKYRIRVSPEDTLVRARQFVGRPEQAFSRYARESLYDYLSDTSIGDVDRVSRERSVVEKFGQALELARPLIGIHQPALQRLHGTAAYRRQYKFSTVPFEGLAIRAAIKKSMTDDPSIDPAASTNFDKAVEGESPITRIDIFGSYPSAFPLAFRSLLEPISSQWAGLAAHMHDNFWQWRRGRSLPSALPMGRAQRQAVVAGWLIGRITGMIRIPDNAGAIGARPVEVKDPTTGTWCAFPRDLLVPRTRYKVQADLLVGLLESMSIAIADCYQTAHQEPLQAYTALRRLYDDTPNEPPKGTLDRLSGARILSSWLATGSTEAGSNLGADLRHADAHTRRARLDQWIEETRESITEMRAINYTQPFTNRPRMVDLADDLLWALDRIDELSRERVVSDPQPGGPDQPKDVNF